MMTNSYHDWYLLYLMPSIENGACFEPTWTPSLNIYGS
jgi:hypothetical protein